MAPQTRRQSSQTGQGQAKKAVKVEEDTSSGSEQGRLTFEPGKTEIRFVDSEQARLQRILATQAAATPRPFDTPARPPARRSWPWWLLLVLAIASWHASTTPSSPLHALDRARTSLTSRIDALGQPYLHKAEPYYAPLRPHLSRVDGAIDQLTATVHQRLSPLLATASGKLHAVAEPYLHRSRQLYQAHLEPHLSRYSRIGTSLYDLNVSPRLQDLSEQAGLHSRRASRVLSKHYADTQQRHWPALRKWYAARAQPAARLASQRAHALYAQMLRPALLKLLELLNSLVTGQALPHLRRFHSLYVKPQLDRVTDKVFEYKTQKVAHDAAARLDEQVAELKEADAELDDFLAELSAHVVEPTASESTLGVPLATASPEEDAAREQALQAAREEKRVRERERILALHDGFEAEVQTLAEKENGLLQERLASLRRAALADLDDRFQPKLADLKDEAAKYKAKLTRYFARLASKRRTEADPELAADARAIAAKAGRKFQARVDAAVDELEEYKRTHVAKEAGAVDKAHASVKAVVGAAQDKLGYEYMWMDDVAVKDWSRYHELVGREQQWLSTYRAWLASSTVDQKLVDIEDQIEGVLEAFEKELADVEDAGLAALKPPNPIVQGLKDAVGNAQESLASVTEGIKDGAVHASRSVVSAFGGTPEPTDLQGTASSLYAQATDSALSAYYDQVAPLIEKVSVPSVQGVTDLPSSASSLYAQATDSALSAYYDQVAPIIEKVKVPADAVQDSAASAYASVSSYASEGASNVVDAAAAVINDASASLHAATRSIARAVGATPTPEGVVERVQSAYEAAASRVADALPNVDLGESAASLVSDASRSVHEATRAAARAVGATPSPEGAAEHLESVYEAASAQAAHLADQPILASASSLLSEGAASAQSAAAHLLASGSSLASDASSILHQATRSALSAAGVPPSPENARETAASLYSSAVGQIPEALLPSLGLSSALDAASSAVSSATETLKAAVGASTSTDGLVGRLSSAVSDTLPSNVHEAYSRVRAEL